MTKQSNLSKGKSESAQNPMALITEMDSIQKFEYTLSLEGRPSVEVKDVLKILMQDKDSSVRGEATRIMGEHADEEDVELLAEILLKDKDSLVRTDAAGALAGIKSFKALSALISSLTTDKSPLVRSWAAFSLGESECIEILPFILWMKRKVRSPRVHKSLCYAAFKLGHKSSLKPLTSYLLNEDYILRGAAANNLFYLKDLLSYEEINEVVLPALNASLALDDNINVRNIHSQFVQFASYKREQQEGCTNIVS